MSEPKQLTGFDAGLSGDDQIRIALQRMIERGGEAQMPDIYEAVEARIRPNGFALSRQGRASLRFFVNRVAVQAGYVYPHDKANPGWRITPEGRDFVGSPPAAPEVAVNVDTGTEERVLPKLGSRCSIRAMGHGALAFRLSVLRLVRSGAPQVHGARVGFCRDASW